MDVVEPGAMATGEPRQPVAEEEPRHPFLVALGERVRTLRSRRGMTRKAVAVAADVSERHLANLEYGTGNASILVLLLVSQALQCSLAELLGDTVFTPNPLTDSQITDLQKKFQIRQQRSLWRDRASDGMVCVSDSKTLPWLDDYQVWSN